MPDVHACMYLCCHADVCPCVWTYSMARLSNTEKILGGLDGGQRGKDARNQGPEA